jgi:hypothetical protein
MKLAAVRMGAPILMLVLFGGCTRVVHWGKSHFEQGEQLNYDKTIAQRNMRSITVYDQLSTSAMFDVLWLSDEVRTLYTDLYSRKNGRGEQQTKLFLRRQLEENNHYIVFYVISLYEVPLTENSNWSMFLRVGSDDFFPIEIKSVDLSPEYMEIMSKRLNRFKTTYCVKFEAEDMDGNLILTPDIRQMALYFRSVDKQAVLVWMLDENGNALPSNVRYEERNDNKLDIV